MVIFWNSILGDGRQESSQAYNCSQIGSSSVEPTSVHSEGRASEFRKWARCRRAAPVASLTVIDGKAAEISPLVLRAARDHLVARSAGGEAALSARREQRTRSMAPCTKTEIPSLPARFTSTYI